MLDAGEYFAYLDYMDWYMMQDAINLYIEEQKDV